MAGGEGKIFKYSREYGKTFSKVYTRGPNQTFKEGYIRDTVTKLNEKEERARQIYNRDRSHMIQLSPIVFENSVKEFSKNDEKFCFLSQDFARDGPSNSFSKKLLLVF